MKHIISQRVLIPFELTLLETSELYDYLKQIHQGKDISKSSKLDKLYQKILKSSQI